MNLANVKIRTWCAYLGALHTAANGSIALPVSYNCPRRPNSLTGCGTCLACTQEVLMRALHLSSDCPAGVEHYTAYALAQGVFQYVTGLDERLKTGAGAFEDFAQMTSEHYGRVMSWAATMVEIEQAAGSSAAGDALAEQAEAPSPREAFPYSVTLPNHDGAGNILTWFTHRADRLQYCLRHGFWNDAQIIAFRDPHWDNRPRIFEGHEQRPMAQQPSADQDWMIQSPPPLALTDEWGRPRCQKPVQFVDAPQLSVQCALEVNHRGDCDTLPEVPAAGITSNWRKW